MSDENNVLVNEEGELLVHEDNLLQTAEMSQEELEILQASKDAALFVQELGREITPRRVALSGLVLMLIVGAIFSGWYWVVPRDSVMVETLYMQRGGHLVMSEIHNTGSRAITDVELSLIHI